MSMYKSERKKEIINKGVMILLLGATGSAKSTLLTEAAQGDIPKEVLKIREAKGKGSVGFVKITFTDYEGLSEEKIYSEITMNCQTKEDIDDDGFMVQEIVYSIAKDVASKKNSNCNIEDKCRKALQHCLKKPNNNTLCYKLKDVSNENKERIIKAILEVIKGLNLKSIFDETKREKGDTKKKKVFKNLLIQKTRNRLNIVWDVILGIINEDVKNFSKKLETEMGAVKDAENETWRFVIDESNYKNELVEKIFKSEDTSQEYLFSDVKLLVRAKRGLFDVDYADRLAVAEYDEKKCHNIQLIDTMGIYHADYSNPDSEDEKIKDYLTKYHADRVIFVISSDTDATVKKADNSIINVLESVNSDLQSHILYTKWDKYLQEVFIQNKRSNEEFAKTPDELFKIAEENQMKKYHEIENAINENDNKRKPKIVSLSRAAFTYDDSDVSKILKSNKIGYEYAIKDIVKNVALNLYKNGEKYKVSQNVDNCIALTEINYDQEHDISALFENLCICKSKVLHQSTVRACIRKFLQIGDIHKSSVNEENGFENIETEFVREIRNYSQKFISNVEIVNSEFLLSDNIDKFKESFIKYLKDYQYLGRITTMLIGKDAYEKGFMKDSYWKYQYERWNDMLVYLQDEYFSSLSIKYNEKFNECLEKALKICFDEFINSKCIVVY